MFSYAETDAAALEQAREWKGTMVDAHYTDPVVDPAQIYRNGEAQVADEDFAKQVICSADPAHHVERIRALEQLGATIVVLMNVSGRDPIRALRVYGERVLPDLRVAGGVTAYVLRDRLRGLAGRAGDRAERAGVAVGGGTRYTVEKPNDPTLARKVESELFRDGNVQKGSIDVNAQHGRVQLRGVAESQELIDDLVQRTRNVDGVRDVENLLHLPGSSAPMHQ
jgi:hypothetical protein